jgi:hypothetical protein
VTAKQRVVMIKCRFEDGLIARVLCRYRKGKYYVGFEVLTAVKSRLLAALLNYSTTLKMEAIRSSETSGTTQRTTRRHIPEKDTLQENITLHYGAK